MKNLIEPKDEAEADIIQLVLKEQGILAEIKSFHDTAYDGLFQAQYGWGFIRVSEADFQKAKKIIEEWKKASPEDLPWETG